MESPAGERRIVAVLISDVVDSTVIGERLGPERSKFLFDAQRRRRFGASLLRGQGPDHF